MKTKELLERLGEISCLITSLYGEISAELPDLRVVVNNACESELKKIFPGKC